RRPGDGECRGLPATGQPQPCLRPHARGRQHPQRRALRRRRIVMIRFYYGSGSPFSWRVQLVLEEKGLDYEPVLLSFDKGEHKSAAHLARSPHGKVPALEDDGVTLYESSAIVEYLEERYPREPLLPPGPAPRPRVRIEALEGLLYFDERSLGRAPRGRGSSTAAPRCGRGRATSGAIRPTGGGSSSSGVPHPQDLGRRRHRGKEAERVRMVAGAHIPERHRRTVTGGRSPRGDPS